MATTYQSNAVKAGYGISPRMVEKGDFSVIAVFEAATQLIVNDVIQMLKVPAGATVVDLKLAVDDLDSGTACVLAVGDGTVADRFISGSTIGQGGGVVELGAGVTGAAAADLAGYKYAAEDTIDVKVTTAPAGGGVGTIKLIALLTMEPIQG